MKHVLIAVLTLFVGISSVSASEVPTNPTYSKDVAPIFNANCVQCHRPGDIGPMSLLSFDEVRPWAKSIQKNVESKTMPPWHADAGVGQFKNDRSLEDWEIKTIVQWAKRGAKQGDPADLPPAPEVNSGSWRLGEPDIIVGFRKVKLKAGGPDRFFDLSGKTGLKEDQWIRAIEVMPGNRKVVHHVIIWQGGQGSDGWLGAWAAGMEPMVFPEGTGRKLKAGVPIIGDMHYHPADTRETDETQIGLYLADDSEIDKELINLWIQNASFEIPAGDPDYKARARHTFRQDAYIMAFLPHMHYRGKEFTYTARFPDGHKEKLLQVSNYDFNWQTGYNVEEPIFVPKGTRIDCVATWDNSADNPANPDPTRNVRFGDESYDEMMIGFIDYVVADGKTADSPEDAIEAIAKTLHQKKPGDIYRLDVIPEGDPAFLGAVELPRDKDTGVWHVSLMGSLREAEVTDITWSGNHVTADVTVIGQTFALSADWDPDTNKLSGAVEEVDDPGNGAPIRGHRVKD